MLPFIGLYLLGCHKDTALFSCLLLFVFVLKREQAINTTSSSLFGLVLSLLGQHQLALCVKWDYFMRSPELEHHQHCRCRSSITINTPFTWSIAPKLSVPWVSLCLHCAAEQSSIYRYKSSFSLNTMNY